jgi:hypothetical protein
LPPGPQGPGGSVFGRLAWTLGAGRVPCVCGRLAQNNQVILVVWEYHNLNQMVKDLVQMKGGDPKQVPDWPGGEYDRIDILRIPGGNGPVTFAQDYENLNHLSDDCPGAK